MQFHSNNKKEREKRKLVSLGLKIPLFTHEGKCIKFFTLYVYAFEIRLSVMSVGVKYKIKKSHLKMLNTISYTTCNFILLSKMTIKVHPDDKYLPTHLYELPLEVHEFVIIIMKYNFNGNSYHDFGCIGLVCYIYTIIESYSDVFYGGVRFC